MTTEYYMPQHYMEYSQYDYTYQPPYVPPVQHDRDDMLEGVIELQEEFNQMLFEQIRLMNKQLAHLEEGEGQNQNRNTYDPPHCLPLKYFRCNTKRK